eukprot:5846718-Pyramimonas_sp.AAC.1
MCQYNRVGQIWITPLYLKDDNQPYTSIRIDDMYETCKDASSLRNWFIPGTPYNLKCPDPIPIVFSHAFMMDAYYAGTLARGYDGSWIQAPSADVTGITPHGITPSDTLCANDPWRAQIQQLPVPAGQPASFAPMCRTITPFGTPQTVGSNS